MCNENVVASINGQPRAIYIVDYVIDNLDVIRLVADPGSGHELKPWGTGTAAGGQGSGGGQRGRVRAREGGRHPPLPAPPRVFPTCVEAHHEPHCLRLEDSVAGDEDVRAATLKIPAKSHVVQPGVDHVAILRAAGQTSWGRSSGSCSGATAHNGSPSDVAAERIPRGPLPASLSWPCGNTCAQRTLHRTQSGGATSRHHPHLHPRRLPALPRHLWRCLLPAQRRSAL